MKHPLFEFFDKGRPYIDRDSSKWPEEWKAVRYKSYPRYPKIILPRPRLPKISFKEIIFKRKSERNFAKEALTLEEISNLLFYSGGIVRENNDLKKRAQPSGGGLYPLEIYALIFKDGKDIRKSVYHYNVLNHLLERLPEENIENLKSAFHYPWVADAFMLILISFIEERVRLKYGNLAYKLGLIEAGHIGQNIYFNCSAMGLKCCASGGLNYETVNKALDLDGISETVIYSLAVGK